MVDPYQTRKSLLNGEKQKGSIDDEEISYDVKMLNEDESMFFSIGNPAVEIHTGYIHLYRESHADLSRTDDNGLPQQRGQMICVLAIPSFLSISSFVSFISCFKNRLNIIRILRDQSPNKYMALLYFSDQKSADSFYKQYNGKPFNSFDPEDCKLAFVSSVEITSKDDQFNQTFLPYANGLSALHDSLKENESTSSSTTPFSHKNNEIPTCPVCLERLDYEHSGIIATLCNHSFHSDCFTKWGDGTCPVCRFSISDTSVTCGVCDTNDNLWICLTCGNVGCGRYANAHARMHFEMTQHTYSMEIESQRVWDYSGDGYVHRLVANKADGKLVEVANPGEKGMDELAEARYNSKLDMVAMEYNELLTQQLSSQRMFFEARIGEIEKEKESQIENLLAELVSFRAERQKMHNKMEKNQNQIKKQSEEATFWKQLNTTLIENQKQFKARIENMEKQFELKLSHKDSIINELKDEIKDLYMHLETKSKIDSNPEIEGGSLVLVTQPNHNQSHQQESVSSPIKGPKKKVGRKK
ncbi:BRCA1-associated protein [Acrasis kona]|uniref:BRCA1-associated protein n=1 Tax=Acrasis kona TaxID=1008807 RepID=A0AAW2Z673_9EUKA